MAPWAVILSDLLNRAGLGLFVTSVKTSEENLGVARRGIDCSQHDAFPGEEWAHTVGYCAAEMAPLQGDANSSWTKDEKQKNNKIRSVFSMVFKEVGEELAIDFQGDLSS